MASSSTDPSNPSSSIQRCCRCNMQAKCKRCACVRLNRPCSCCLPGDSNNCHNRRQSGSPAQVSSAPSTPSPASAEPLSTASSPDASAARTGLPVTAPSLHASAPPPPIPCALPTLSSVFQTHIPTLQHVPKGVRDVWAKALHVCLSEVVRDPADLSLWTRLFMLAKCVLASPAAGHRLPWREILQRVKGRLQRWFAGDLGSLWLEACASGHSLSKRADSSASTSSQRSNNVRRAKLAVQDGQFTKALQALTSEGLAPPSPSGNGGQAPTGPCSRPTSRPSAPISESL